MQSKVLGILLWLFVSSILLAQDSSNTSLVKDKFALQFGVRGLNLDAFQGSNLSCKYHISDKSALRLGFDLSARNDLENRINNINGDKYESFSTSLNIQYVEYVKTEEDISLYFGSGPYYSRYFSKSVSNYYNENAWSLGVNGIIGLEWFFKKSMSLNGEYGLSISYNRSRYIDSDKNNLFVQSISVGSKNQFKIGLSVYL